MYDKMIELKQDIGDKMARPRDRGEQRSAIINIRVTPELKEAIEAQARASGVTLSKECEVRLAESLQGPFDPNSATGKLLRRLAEEIAATEEFIGSKWDESAAAWAAVRELLYRGPIVEMRPVDAEKTNRLHRLRREQSDIRLQKLELIEALGAMGITAPYDPRDGLNALLLIGTSGPPERTRERATLESLDGDRSHLEAAEAGIGTLEELDANEWEATHQVFELAYELTESIRSGRQFATLPTPDPLLEAAEELAGRVPNRRILAPSSLGGLFGGKPKRDNDPA